MALAGAAGVVYSGAGTVRGLNFEQMAVGLLFVAIACGACMMHAQSDTYWHLRAGEDIWRTLSVPLTDSYSYTAAGRFWPDHEWLWQAVAYVLHGVGGFPLLLLFGATAITAAFVAIYRLMVGPPLMRFWLLLASLPLSASVWALRPQIVSLALLALTVSLIARERFIWLPPLFLLWANVHGAVALGGVVLGVGMVTTAWALPLPRLGWHPISEGALAAVRACPGPLYNQYDEGGYLIWLAREKPVFVDSRQDPYPAPFVLEAEALETTGNFEATFARLHITCAILPAASPVAPRLHRAGWWASFADEKWTVMQAPGVL